MTKRYGSVVAVAANHYKHPRTPFVARFMGGRNLQSGEVVSSHDRRATVQSEGGARFAIPIDAAQVGDKVVLRKTWASP